jgi:hypothetical protein
MNEIQSYLEHLISHSATELRLEPNQIPYITTASGQVNVSPVQIQGGQISMLVFPMIPIEARQNLTRQDEVEFPYSTNLGLFNVRIRKSPTGLNVTINPTNGVPINPPSSAPQVYKPIETPPPASQVYRPIEILPENEIPQPSFNSNAFYQPNATAVEDSPVAPNDTSENSASLNYYLRKLKENRGLEVILTPNKEAVLVTNNDRIKISTKPLFETHISLLIDPLLPIEVKKVLNEQNKAEFGHNNQFGKFLIVLEKSGYDTSVRIKFAPLEEKPVAVVEQVEQVDESNFLGANAPVAQVAFNSNAKQQMDDFFHKMSNMGASDLHLSATMLPLVRKDGRMLPLSKDFPAVSPDKMKELLTSIMPEKNREEFDRRKDTDFAYEIKGLARFRANIFMDRKGMGGVFRVIPSEILTAQKLGLSDAILDLCNLSKGLVVVTGPTGSGKSTTKNA